MYTLRRRPLLLYGQLLPQAAAVPAMRAVADCVRQLLSQAAAVHSVCQIPVLRGRLLPKTVSATLLPGEVTSRRHRPGYRLRSVFPV